MGKIISWNVNGLNEVKKRNIIFNWLKEQKCVICCLEEIHIIYKHQKFLKTSYLGEEFISSDAKKKRGNGHICKERFESLLKIQS